MKRLVIGALMVALTAAISPAVAGDPPPRPADPKRIQFTPRINGNEVGTVCIQWPNPLGCQVFSR